MNIEDVISIQDVPEMLQALEQSRRASASALEVMQKDNDRYGENKYSISQQGLIKGYTNLIRALEEYQWTTRKQQRER